ncbi:MAG: hypothetical protein WDA16_14905, partial [Candidatus Thermoplasmatota archaeon]
MVRAAATLLVALLALGVLVPVVDSAGTSAPWKVDETLTLTDAAHMRREWRIQYDVYPTHWTLAAPIGAAFVAAHNSQGKALVASATDGQVTVTSDGPEFFVVFTEPLVANGAFLVAKAGVSAREDSPSSVHFSLPAGWSMPGWAGSDGLAAPVNGTWTSVGPFYVDALLLPPGTKDAGPDARGKPHGVVREAKAALHDGEAFLNVTLVYDTDDYSPSWSLPLPTDATLLAVTAPLPNSTFRVASGSTIIKSPYPTAHHLGPRAFTLHYAIDVSTFGGGYQRANLSVPGSPGDDLTFHVTLAGGLEFVGSRLDGALVKQQEEYLAKGPSTLSIAYLPPTPTGAVRFTQGPFFVQAPASLEAQARLAA